MKLNSPLHLLPLFALACSSSHASLERSGPATLVPVATESAEATTFDGVYTMPLDYTVRQLLRAVDKSPRSFAASPVFRMFLRLAGVFPGWAERRMLASTRSTLERSASEAPLPSSVRQS